MYDVYICGFRTFDNTLMQNIEGMTCGVRYVRALVLILMVTHKVLMQARHPCVEAMDDMSFIPNDVVLKREDSNLQIITGPNMGGKSTYIRQVLLLLSQRI
jgi:dsDNA-specific endonuclease/ATPase MutS2